MNNLFEKYPYLRKPLVDLGRVKGVKILIIYGSYARFSAEKDSDLDSLIIGNNVNRDKVKENLVSLNLEPSIKIEIPAQFEKKKGDALHTQIINEGIVVKGIEEFIRFLG